MFVQRVNAVGDDGEKVVVHLMGVRARRSSGESRMEATFNFQAFGRLMFSLILLQSGIGV